MTTELFFAASFTAQECNGQVRTEPFAIRITTEELLEAVLRTVHGREMAPPGRQISEIIIPSEDDGLETSQIARSFGLGTDGEFEVVIHAVCGEEIPFIAPEEGEGGALSRILAFSLAGGTTNHHPQPSIIEP